MWISRSCLLSILDSKSLALASSLLTLMPKTLSLLTGYGVHSKINTNRRIKGFDDHVRVATWAYILWDETNSRDNLSTMRGRESVVVPLERERPTVLAWWWRKHTSEWGLWRLVLSLDMQPLARTVWVQWATSWANCLPLLLELQLFLSGPILVSSANVPKS